MARLPTQRPPGGWLGVRWRRAAVLAIAVNVGMFAAVAIRGSDGNPAGSTSSASDPAGSTLSASDQAAVDQMLEETVKSEAIREAKDTPAARQALLRTARSWKPLGVDRALRDLRASVGSDIKPVVIGSGIVGFESSDVPWLTCQLFPSAAERPSATTASYKQMTYQAANIRCNAESIYIIEPNEVAMLALFRRWSGNPRYQPLVYEEAP